MPINENTTHRQFSQWKIDSRYGYKLYDDNADFVGVVCPEPEKGKSYGVCLCVFLKQYEGKYRHYHRIKSHHKSIPFEELERQLEVDGKYSFWVDKYKAVWRVTNEQALRPKW